MRFTCIVSGAVFWTEASFDLVSLLGSDTVLKWAYVLTCLIETTFDDGMAFTKGNEITRCVDW